MNNIIKTLAGVAFAAAVAVGISLLPSDKATASGLGGSPPTIYSAAYHSPGGATNITTGYTNTGNYVSVAGTMLTLDLKYGGYDVNCSNAIVLVAYQAFDSGSHATTAASRISLATSATTYTEVITNVSTVWGAPYAFIVLESPASNLSTVTNVVLRVDSSIP